MTRITVDLDPPVHSTLNLWIARNAATIGPPHVKLAEVIAAMVVTTARYEDVTDTVCSQRMRRTRPRLAVIGPGLTAAAELRRAPVELGCLAVGGRALP
jgi:hypothetical protein